jgi:hypothetical protein
MSQQEERAINLGEGGQNVSREAGEAEKPERSGEKRREAEAALLVTAQIEQPRADCLCYRWDEEERALYLEGRYRVTREPGNAAPADLATVLLAENMTLPLLVLLPGSAAPGVRLRARILAALCYPSPQNTAGMAQPEAAACFFIGALPDDEEARVSVASAQWRRLLVDWLRSRRQEEGRPLEREPYWLDEEKAAKMIRELRLAARQARRKQGASRPRLSPGEEPLTWRSAAALAQLGSSLRAGGLLLKADASLPYAQPARLIRLLAPRFQQILSDILQDDEEVLIFVERPPLRRRTGWWHRRSGGPGSAGEGLLLVTNQQLLWLSEYFAQGSSFAQGGYIARSLPVERLAGCRLLEAASEESALRLQVESEAMAGKEILEIVFPASGEAEEALQRVCEILAAFLPPPAGQQDRRLRLLPVVEAWQPPARLQQELNDLGGALPEAVAARLKRQLEEIVQAEGDEVLMTIGVPELASYRSPARLVALTRRAVLILEEAGGPRWHRHSGRHHLLRYAPANISSLELRYSLFGSGLTLFLPQGTAAPIRQDIPFAGPAYALFLPFFTRLRTLMRLPAAVGGSQPGVANGDTSKRSAQASARKE